MLEVDHISVYYGDIQVIYDLSLAVGDREIVTLIGGNGAGKTTTVNTISGLLRPRSGDIRYCGTSILRIPPHQLVEMGLVQVPEGRMLFPRLTARQNLKMGCYSRGTRKELDRRMEWVFELFPQLRERQSQQVSTMSGGEQQMLAIARGLMSSPKLLILDEPSTGLAPVLVGEMFRVVKEINRNDVSILLIEQNAVQALQGSDRGYVLEHGHLAYEGSAESLLNNDMVRSAYLGI
ncbi:MAG: ABC transporter ATP-binding protein [Candidatus Methylomirabilia bacterium]